MADTEPITLHIPASLTTYNKPAADLLVDHSGARAMAVGAYVFAHPTTLDGTGPRLLLVRREKGDGVLAGKWEIPGGGCDASDPTVFHSTARELFEEAGLHMTSAVDKAASDNYFLTRSKLSVVKLNFEVRVKEAVDGVALETIPVELSNEHQGFAWATEAEISDDSKYPMTHPEQKQSIIEAFQHHRARLVRASTAPSLAYIQSSQT
jgi:8-oxo-dGTP pyrophosphatase MutT (NUDIX family)